MTYIWLGKEHHGYTYVFSSQEKADMWLIGECEDILYHWDDEDAVDIYIGRHGEVCVYFGGDLCAHVERVMVDETT